MVVTLVTLTSSYRRRPSPASGLLSEGRQSGCLELQAPLKLTVAMTSRFEEADARVENSSECRRS